MQLSPAQVRVLGCLVEKEHTTPDSYPLTMNSLIAACNQTTNRYPVVSFNQATVESAVDNLRAENLLRIDYSRSKRADKYRHVLDQALGLDRSELALLSVLMLRGPQTTAELRTRSERQHAFAGQDEMEITLTGLAARAEPLVVRLERGAGQKEARWAHLLTGQVPADAVGPPPELSRGSRADRLEALESAVSTLTEEVARLHVEQQSLAAQVRQLLE